MKNKIRIISLTLALSVALSPYPFAQDSEDEEEIFELSPFTVDASNSVGYRATGTLAGTRFRGSTKMGATVGGAQDINYARSQIKDGKIPLPNTFTSEGLFSEHDLPLSNSNSCDSMICVIAEAMPARISQKPETVAFAQIGFSSGLDPETWEPEPLNLVAVVDKSGSMSGNPIQLVKDSLLQILKQLGSHDQLSIVLYGDRSHVFMPPIIASNQNKRKIEDYIRSIQSAGSTNMESGLRVGYTLAADSSKTFEGNTRLMLFTDEQPNVGNTSAEGFMGLMETGSEKGIGLTTIGVGVQFGAELANKVSTVRGGNLFFFPDRPKMINTFKKEFDTMVTELAYEMDLTISPKSGYKVSEVFGLPADAFEWNKDSITLTVQTLFLSRKKGAMYIGFERDEPGYTATEEFTDQEIIAEISLDYLSGKEDLPTYQNFKLKNSPRSNAPLGLTRGEALVEEYLCLVEASKAVHTKHNYKYARNIIKDLSQTLWNSKDPSLTIEITMIDDLRKTLTKLVSDNSNFLSLSNPLEGKWVAYPQTDKILGNQMLISFSTNSVFEAVTYKSDGSKSKSEMGKTFKEEESTRKRGRLTIETSKRYISAYKDFCEIIAEPDSALETDIATIEYKIKGRQLTATIAYRDGTIVEDLRFVKTDAARFDNQEI